MEYALGAVQFSGFMLSGYQFIKYQRDQVQLIEFIDFIQKATVFNPTLLKTVMDEHGPEIYHKSFKRFEEDPNFARGVGFVQGFVQCVQPIRSLLNNSSKLVLSKLTSETIFSNGEFSQTDKQADITSMVNGFQMTDSSGDNSINISSNSSVDFSMALHSIHSTSQIRSLSSAEKIMSWIVFLAKIVMSAFKMGTVLKGFRVGHKNIEKGIVIGQYMVAFGEIIFDRVNKDLTMKNPIFFLKDKMQKVDILKKKRAALNFKMTFLFFLMVFFGISFLRQLTKWIYRLVAHYKKIKELKRMKKTFEVSKTLSDDYKCIICIENAKNVIFRPCLHLAICKICYDRLRENQCPICKKPIESFISIYIA
jgi:Zinc finger, C3HC4 type (RING finger)